MLECYRNTIKGTAMDNLIASLPLNSTSDVFEFRVCNYANEGNECTATQVVTARGKGWTPKYYTNDGWKWIDYEGSDAGTGIEILSSPASPSAPVYSLSGQRLTAPKKGINIIGGKKVVVK